MSSWTSIQPVNATQVDQKIADDNVLESSTFVSAIVVPAATGVGATDTANINTAIAAVNARPNGAVLSFPAGTYQVTAALTAITVPVSIRGAGMGWHAQGSPGATKLVCAAGIGGLSLTSTSNFSRVEGLDLVSLSTVAQNFDGLTIRGQQCQIVAVAVEGFGRYGFNLDTSVAGNVNITRMDGCRAYANRSHGYYIHGMNSQAMVLTGCDATGNLGWGYYIGSSNNNTLVGCHASANILGAHYDNGGSNSYLNPYVEAGTGNNCTFDTNNTYTSWQAGGYVNPVITWLGGSLVSAVVTSMGAQYDHIAVVGNGAVKYGLYSGNWNPGWLSLRDDTNMVEIFDCAPNGGPINFRVPLVFAAPVNLLASATGSRPYAGNYASGACIFDTTLHKPIWSDGTVWKDATGTTV